MGQVLEFYALPWHELSDMLGSGDITLAETLEQKIQAQRSEWNEEVSASGIPSWREALHRLIMKPGGGLQLTNDIQTKSDAVIEVDSGTAEAFVGIIRCQGNFLGFLRHHSRAGSDFRETFLEQEVRNCLRPPFDPESLWNRSLCGLSADAFPCWGGLTQSEIAAVISKNTVDTLPELDSPDHSSWLFELWDILSAAGDSDIVTVYY